MGWQLVGKLVRCPALLVCVICTACQTAAVPTAPTSAAGPTSPSPPPTPARGFDLSGVVRSGGVPIAGARVAVLAGYQLLDSTATDTAGAYSLSGVVNLDPFSGALVSASSTDFFTATKYVWVDSGRKLDFDLERAVYIAVGQTLQSAMPERLVRCASLGYGGGEGAVCQRFAVTAPASGTLSVTASSDPPMPFDATLLRPDGSIGDYGASNSTVQVAIDVTAGLTYQIDVVPIGAAGFKLTVLIR